MPRLLGVFVLLLGIGSGAIAGAAGAPAAADTQPADTQPAAAPVPASDIEGFLACVNLTFKGAKKNDGHSVLGTADCLEATQCKMTWTMSQRSAQPACEVNTPKDVYAFPRVILECKVKGENRSFRPSYGLCPTSTTFSHVELGRDVPAVVLSADPKVQNQGAEKLADIPIDPAADFAALELANIVNLVGGEAGAAGKYANGSQHCGKGCHNHSWVNGKGVVFTPETSKNEKATADMLMSPQSPFAFFDNALQKEGISTQGDVVFNNTSTGGLKGGAQTLQGVCNKIKKGQADIVKALSDNGNANAARDTATSIALCFKLADILSAK